jgi:hypothetical protein
MFSFCHRVSGVSPRGVTEIFFVEGKINIGNVDNKFQDSSWKSHLAKQKSSKGDLYVLFVVGIDVAAREKSVFL